jgi:hypothetical protein
MIPTATIVVVLVAAFLLGVKFTVDLIRHRRRKVDLSRGEKAWSHPVVQSSAMTKFATVLKHLEQERIRLTSRIDQVGKALVALTGRSMIRKRRLSATAIARIRAAQKARWAKWRKAQKKR